MRVISGKYKRMELKGFNIDGIRPTMDKVKEAIFAMIQDYIPDSVCLDLFAGTGALGLEAISRGASYAILNDKSTEALRIISANVTLTQAQNCVKISRKEYDKCLKSLKGEKFDIIFLDPPYATNYERDALEKIVEHELLSQDGIIILETDKRKEINEEINGLEMKDKRTYGRVTIRVYKWKE